MNWEAIGAIGEIVGALAVVISLIYLASQIRVQNREAQIACAHEISVGFRESIASTQDPYIAALTLKAFRDFDGLEEAEKLQFFSISQSYLRVWEEAHYQYQQARLDEGMWRAMNTQFTDLMAAEAIQKVWALRKHTYHPNFRLYIESVKPGKLTWG